MFEAEKRQTDRHRIYTNAKLLATVGDKDVVYKVSIFDISRGGVGIMSSIDVMFTPMYELVLEQFRFYRTGKMQSTKEMTTKVKRYGFKFTRPLTNEEFNGLVKLLA